MDTVDIEKKVGAPEEDFISIDDGAKRVPIKNLQGEEIGVFYFRPTDVAIVKRYQEVADKFPAAVEPLSHIDIKPDGTADVESENEILEKCENNVYELINYLFGGDAAGPFFGKMHPFSPVNGKFYVENVLNMVSQYIAKQFTIETKKVNENVNKYVHGYRTGAHKDGKK